MAVTNYYSVGGMLIGEETSGVRTDYLTDALGSVTVTVDQTGNVMNTYRYKPYGALLAKTGTAPDPAFGWVGQEGYRQTGRKYSDSYVRARHYGTSQAQWTTKDPASEKGNSYDYAMVNPTNHIDPSGLVTIYAYTPITVGDCGAYDMLFLWWLDKPNSCMSNRNPSRGKPATNRGWLVQQVTTFEIRFPCGSIVPIIEATVFWEASPVPNGKFTPFGFSRSDESGHAPRYNSTGTQSAIGLLKFFCESVTGDLSSDPVWKTGPRPVQGGSEISTSTLPSWFNGNSSSGEAPARRSVNAAWNCCCPPPMYSNAVADPSEPRRF